MKERYEIFNRWYKIMGYIMDKAEKFPKSVRFSVSDRMINMSFDIMEGIVESIYIKERKHILARINIDLEKIRIYTRISKDRRYISLRQYEHLSGELNEFGSMVGGWIKKQ